MTHSKRAFFGPFSSSANCSFAGAERHGCEPSDVNACSATLPALTTLASNPGATASGSAALGTCIPSCY